jgi:peroxiredoxin
MKKISRREILTWAAILTICALISYSITRDPNRRELIGQEAPRVFGTDEAGHQVDLGPQAGKVIILNLYANWCPPCREEIPELSAFYSQIKDREDTSLIGVAFESGGPSKAIPAGRRLGIDYPLVVGTPQASTAFDLHRYPTTVVIGPQGRIRARVESTVSVPDLQELVRNARKPLVVDPEK